MSTEHSSTENTSMKRIFRQSELFYARFPILGGGTLRYEIRDNGRRKKYYDPLAWIDEIEKWEALFF